MKNNYFTLSLANRRTVLEQTATKLLLPIQAVEKDLWVSTILQILFGLPCAEGLVFKGGTSLSKVWKLISRFSEDIDIAIERKMFNFDDELTKKKVKKLRKASSVFVRENLYSQLTEALIRTPLKDLCQVEVQPDGEGDNTYPEPRSIYIRYTSVFEDKLNYIAPVVKIEAGARSLLEPYEEITITSMVEESLPSISTNIADVKVKTAIPEKTFLEKSFLLHELFSVHDNVEAHRRSRHLYDLYMMMSQGIHENAIKNDNLWQTIHHHRSTLTSMNGVDYTPDIRDRIVIVPPPESIANWEHDYKDMTGAMIYGERPTFSQLIERIKELEQLFHHRNQ